MTIRNLPLKLLWPQRNSHEDWGGTQANTSTDRRKMEISVQNVDWIFNRLYFQPLSLLPSWLKPWASLFDVTHLHVLVTFCNQCILQDVFTQLMVAASSKIIPDFLNWECCLKGASEASVQLSQAVCFHYQPTHFTTGRPYWVTGAWVYITEGYFVHVEASRSVS